MNNFKVAWHILAALLGWLRSLFVRTLPPERLEQVLPELEPAYSLQYVAEEPEKLARRTVYAVGENGHLWHASFICPCGCRATITLNLLPDDEPRWQLTSSRALPTLRPSIRRKVGCKSHFFLEHGKVRWVRGGGR